MNGVSVIICCYNSAGRLEPTLEHLARQKVDQAIPVEIILVDNASTDNTAAVAADTWKQFATAIPLVITEQPIPGLSFAREKGVQTAKYEFLLYCDDDNWLSENYVTNCFKIMSSNPQIGVLGGLGAPYFEDSVDSNRQINAGIFATGPQADQNGEVLISQHVYGAGCIYRKSAIDYLLSNGFIAQLTGRRGINMTAGEDHETCYAMVLAGYKIYYDASLEFKHYVPKERVTFQYIKKLITGFAATVPVLAAYKRIIDKKKGIKASWLFISAASVYHFIKKYKISLFKKLYRLNKTGMPDTDFLYDILSLKFLLSGRRIFIQTKRNIYNGRWYNRNNKGIIQ